MVLFNCHCNNGNVQRIKWNQNKSVSRVNLRQIHILPALGLANLFNRTDFPVLSVPTTETMFNGCSISLNLDNVVSLQVVLPLSVDTNTIGAWKIGLSGLFGKNKMFDTTLYTQM
jgi:hypothetical protein